MKPKAALKSSNVNFLLMASRPLTSLQPVSLASAVLRASPVSFCAMVAYLSMRPIVPESRAAATRKGGRAYLPTAWPSSSCDCDSRCALREAPCPGRSTSARSPARRSASTSPSCCSWSGFSAPSYGAGGSEAAWTSAHLPAAAVRLRAGARIRPHLHRARLRRRDAGRDAAADRRRGAARAHPRGAATRNS